MLNVKQENTGWRDEKLSRRHREWGYDCPAVDLDCLFINYNKRKVVGCVEYKRECVDVAAFMRSATCEAMRDFIKDQPFVVVRYANNLTWFEVTPANQPALQIFKRVVPLSEKKYVAFLYDIRGLKVPDDIEQTLTDEVKGYIPQVPPTSNARKYPVQETPNSNRARAVQELAVFNKYNNR